MKLKSVHIHRHWGNTRQFSCKVDFEGLHGDVSLNLNEDMAQRILEVCADLVVEAGQETAREMVATVIESTTPLPAIEGAA